MSVSNTTGLWLLSQPSRRWSVYFAQELTAPVQLRSTDKARRYIDQLDTARCNGDWSEVPVLVRKVNKHAPQRRCTIGQPYTP